MWILSFFSPNKTSEKSVWTGLIRSLLEERRDFFFLLLLPSQSFFFSPPAPPGGLFHRNVQDLQRVNRPDRPGRAD